MTTTEAPPAPADTPPDAPGEPVEAPPDTDAPDDAPEPPEPEEPEERPVTPTSTLSERDIEERLARLSRESERHAKRIGEIMEEDANDLVVCPLCWEGAPGFRFPVEPEGPQREAVLAALGEAAGDDYEKATDARTCDTCKGKGRVETGSLVPDHRTKPCSTCSGTGYMLVSGPTMAQPAATALTAPSPVPDLPPEPESDADPWGRRPGDPNFGVLPQFVTRR